MESWFLKREYSKQVIECEMEKVNIRKNKKKSRINKKEGVPFVVTYHPKLKSLRKIINDNLYLFYINYEVKKTFTPSHYTSFLQDQQLHSKSLIITTGKDSRIL